MRPTLLLTAVLAAATLTACSDQPTAPATPSAAPAAKRSPAERAADTWTLLEVANTGGDVIAKTSVEIRIDGDPFHELAKVVADNGADDADARVGHYKVRMPYMGKQYLASIKTMPAEYAFVGGFAWGSYGGPTTDLGTMTLRLRPLIELHMKSTFGPYVGGATILFENGGSASQYLYSVQDNGPTDLNPAAGIIRFRAFSSATWQVCETIAPTSMSFASPQCIKAQAPFEGMAAFTMQHAPLLLGS